MTWQGNIIQETDTIIVRDNYLPWDQVNAHHREVICKRCGESVVRVSYILMDHIPMEDLHKPLSDLSAFHYTKCTGVGLLS